MNRAVKRNTSRFPRDFMFQLTAAEAGNLRCQTGTSSYGGRRYLPYVFMEQGVAMLSSVLNSERAVLVNIAVIRTFVRLREMLATNRALASKLAALEQPRPGKAMKLTHVGISHFRSIGEEFVTIDLTKKINVLVGANNCGKSNVLRAPNQTSGFVPSTTSSRR